MMEAELHDGRILEFPDGTDPAVIQETVKKVLSQSSQTGVRETTEETEIQETQTPSSVTQPVTPQQPQQEQVQTSLEMDDLDTNKDWLKNAKTIYENEENETWKGDSKSLSDWFKNRHSEIGFDITSIGSLAYRADDFDDDTKKAWVDSMDMYENTDADTLSFFRALKNVALDPTTIGSVVATAGLGTIAKIGGTRAASLAAKFTMKEQLKKSLAKKVGEETAKEFVEKGVTKGISKEVLKGARKEAAKNLGKAQLKTGAAGGAFYSGADNYSRQKADIKLRDKEDEDFDATQFVLSTGLGAAGGATLGRYLPKLGEKLGRKKALMKQEAFEKADMLPTVQIKETSTIIENLLPEEIVASRVNKAREELEVNGTVDINLQGKRTKTKAERDSIKVPKKTDKGYQTKRELKDNLSEEEVIKEFGFQDFEVNKVGPNKFIGKKTIDTKVDVSNPEVGRTKFQERIAQIKRSIFDDSGLGDKFKALRSRFDVAPRVMEQNITRNFNRLQNALKKEHEGEVSTELYETMDKAFRGDTEALDIVAERTGTETVSALKEMRNQIQSLQKRLLSSGAIKEGSDLQLKIQKSLDPNSDTPDLYVTRQFEVYDNPNYSREFDARPGSAKIKENAGKYIEGQLRKQYKDYDTVKKQIKNLGIKSLREEQLDLIKRFEGADGEVQNRINRILTFNDEQDVATFFSDWNPIKGKAASKILTKRESIPDEIRLLMGEYKNPFTNYANTAMKLNQTLANFDYEQGIAKLVEKNEIPNASRLPGGPRTVELGSRLPQVGGVNDPLKRIPVEGTDYTEPLKGIRATPEVASAIEMGNEIGRTQNKFLQQFLLLQGHTRSAKTVWSPTAIARNFLGAGWMSMGAGYLRPSALKGMANVARGLSNISDDKLQDEIEKGISLGYIQSGTDLGAFRGALKDASEESFWKMQSPLYREKNNIINRAKQLNTSAVKFYQSMDDMWKQFAFLNEKQNYRKVLEDQGINPDEVITTRTFRGGSGKNIKITRLDEYAAEQVNNHMQNYGGVPQFVRRARLFPIADFLAFTTEIIRTQKNIIKNSFKDMREGRAMMAKGERDAQGQLKGKAQLAVGQRRLGSMIAAQSVAPALGATSAVVTGLDEKVKLEDGKEAPYTIREGMAKFDPDFDQGASYIYLGKPKDGKGKKINIDYINPWAKTQQPLKAAIAAYNQGEYVDGVVDDVFDAAIINPLKETFGVSMLGEAAANIFQNVDQFGRPITGKTDTRLEKIGKNISVLAQAFEPGFVKTGRDLMTSMNLEGQDFGVRKGRSGRRLYLNDELAGLTGVKPKYYDINKALRYKVNDVIGNMSEAGKIFSNAVAQMQPQTEDEIVNAYSESLEKQYAQATKLFEVISAAKSTGMNNADIYKAMTSGGFFPKGMSNETLQNMIKKGVYIPKPPIRSDVLKYQEIIKRETEQEPKFKDAKDRLIEVYKSYVGETTGER